MSANEQPAGSLPENLRGGLSIHRVAYLAELSPMTVLAWQRGHNVNVSSISAIARALGVAPADVFAAWYLASMDETREPLAGKSKP